MSPPEPARLRIAADIGGTFTDEVAAFDEKRGILMLGKTLTTPQRLVGGILDGMGKAGVPPAEANLYCTARPSPSKPCSSARVRAPRSLPPAVSVTFMKSGATTARLFQPATPQAFKPHAVRRLSIVSIANNIDTLISQWFPAGLLDSRH
jgi:hypothetical protein